MRARAKNLGAELDIRSEPGSGTSVIVRLAQESPEAQNQAQNRLRTPEPMKLA